MTSFSLNKAVKIQLSNTQAKIELRILFKNKNFNTEKQNSNQNNIWVPALPLIPCVNLVTLPCLSCLSLHIFRTKSLNKIISLVLFRSQNLRFSSLFKFLIYIKKIIHFTKELTTGFLYLVSSSFLKYLSICVSGHSLLSTWLINKVEVNAVRDL